MLRPTGSLLNRATVAHRHPSERATCAFLASAFGPLGLAAISTSCSHTNLRHDDRGFADWCERIEGAQVRVRWWVGASKQMASNEAKGPEKASAQSIVVAWIPPLSLYAAVSTDDGRWVRVLSSSTDR